MATPTVITLEGYAYRYRRMSCTGVAPKHAPVVFVGGAFQSIDSWRRFADAFVVQADVILIDLPGSGGADPLPPQHGLDFLTDALVQVLDAEGIRHAYLVGASYGSPVAYRFAQRFADRVSHLVLAGVMDVLPDGVRAAMVHSISLATAGRMEEFADLAVRQMVCQDPARPIARQRSVERAMRRGLLHMDVDDLRRYVWNTQRLLALDALDLAHPPRVPTLVFTGEHDPFTPPERCRRVARHIPDARFTTIEQADHVFHLERFDEALRLLMEFVDEASPALGRDAA